MRGSITPSRAANSCGASTTRSSTIRADRAGDDLRGHRAAQGSGLRTAEPAGAGIVDRRQLQCLDRRARRQSGLGLLAEARDYLRPALAPQSAKQQRKLAWEELLIAEGSDWNWWYGPEHHSANDRDFDELYRKHLSNVYHALEGIPPEELNTPIMQRRGAAQLHSADRLCARARGWAGERLLRVDGRGQLHLGPAHERDARQAVSAGRGVCRAG